MSVSIEPSPSTEVISFDWSNLIESRIHLSVPFQIVVNVTARQILRTIVDEGASVSILSSTSWQAIGYPKLVSATDQILAFNKNTYYTFRDPSSFSYYIRRENCLY